MSGYNAATTGRRTINIGQSSRGINELALAEGDKLLRMARKAELDNPFACAAIDAFVTEVIGTGIRPHSRHSDPDIGRELEMRFARWVPQASASRRIGTGGKPDSLQDFFCQQSLICRNVIVAGEAFARLRPRYAADLSIGGLEVPLQIDLIEPEQLAFWRRTGDATKGNEIRAGIEFDQVHQRVAYHFYREHPGDTSVWPNAFEVVRVPAESILHCMEFRRGNQIRGITGLAPILILLSDLESLEDGLLYQQKMASYMFAWKKTLTPDDPQMAAMSTSVYGQAAPAGSGYVESQPGGVTILDTNAGEEFGFYSHPGIAASMDAFARSQKQKVAAAMRITYDMMTGDNSSTTFMNARIRLMTLRRGWEQFQRQVMIHQFCRPVWRAWCDAAALAGVISASDYRKNTEDYLNVEWLPDPFDWVDQEKELNVITRKIDACLTSRSRETIKLARDPRQVEDEIAQDQAREEDLGLDPVYGAGGSPPAEKSDPNSPDKGKP